MQERITTTAKAASISDPGPTTGLRTIAKPTPSRRRPTAVKNGPKARRPGGTWSRDQVAPGQDETDDSRPSGKRASAHVQLRAVGKNPRLENRWSNHQRTSAGARAAGRSASAGTGQRSRAPPPVTPDGRSTEPARQIRQLSRSQLPAALKHPCHTHSDKLPKHLLRLESYHVNRVKIVSLKRSDEARLLRDVRQREATAGPAPRPSTAPADGRLSRPPQL